MASSLFLSLFFCKLFFCGENGFAQIIADDEGRRRSSFGLGPRNVPPGCILSRRCGRLLGMSDWPHRIGEKEKLWPCSHGQGKEEKAGRDLAL